MKTIFERMKAIFQLRNEDIIDILIAGSSTIILGLLLASYVHFPDWP